jgi:hypothetical protein
MRDGFLACVGPRACDESRVRDVSGRGEAERAMMPGRVLAPGCATGPER